MDIEAPYPAHNEERRPEKRLKRDGGSKGPSDTANYSSLRLTARKAVSKRLGRLDHIMNMPVDIFAEICSHLHPLDLLHLAWASKVLRSFLMSKSLKSVWKIARQCQEPDMPDCPEFLTEPHYAALVFATVCQECGNPKATRVYYGLYSRFCGRCVGSYVIEVNDVLLGSLNFSNLTLSTFVDIVPTVRAQKTGEWHLVTPTWCSKRTFTKLSREWSELEGEADRAAFIESHTAMVTAMRTHTVALKSWRSEENFKKTQVIRDVRKSRSTSIKEMLLELGWEIHDFPKRVYTSEDREWFRLTEKNQVLTERVWNNIQPKLENFLMEYQQRRLERERKQRMAARKMGLKQYYYNFWLQHSKQSPNILFPGGWDDSRVEDIAPIQDLIEDDNHGPVTQERWEGKVPEIIEFLTQRTSEIEKKLLNWYTASYKQWHKTRPGAPPISDRESDTFDGKGHLDLRRATVVFKCTRCDEPMWYPACFQHKDCFSWQKWSTVTSSNWKPGCPGPLGLTFDPTLTLTVSHLLAQLSIDPVTIASIDLPPPLNPLSPPWVTRENYVCLFCDDDDKYLGCMPQLIEHFRKEIDNFQVREGAIARLGRKAFSKLEEGQETPTLRNDHDLSVIRTPTALWRRVTWDEATVIRERNDSFTLRVQKYYSPEYYSITAKYFQKEKGLNYKCLLCPKVRREKYYTIGLMLNHVKMKHGIDVEKELAVKCTEVEQVEMQAGLAVDTLMDVDDDAVLAGGEL